MVEMWVWTCQCVRLLLENLQCAFGPSWPCIHLCTATTQRALVPLRANMDSWWEIRTSFLVGRTRYQRNARAFPRRSTNTSPSTEAATPHSIRIDKHEAHHKRNTRNATHTTGQRGHEPKAVKNNHHLLRWFPKAMHLPRSSAGAPGLDKATHKPRPCNGDKKHLRTDTLWAANTNANGTTSTEKAKQLAAERARRAHRESSTTRHQRRLQPHRQDHSKCRESCKVKAERNALSRSVCLSPPVQQIGSGKPAKGACVYNNMLLQQPEHMPNDRLDCAQPTEHIINDF
jgi:hypothetical protein